MSLKSKALKYATKAHSGQTRKVSGTLYIEHPIRVAKTLENAGFSVKVVVAGLLHDVVEDTETTNQDLQDGFGMEVSALVAAHTEDKTKSWEERKQHTIDTVKNSSLEIKALIAADKLDNLRSLIADYNQIGDELWSYFKRGYEDQKWYHNSIADNLLIGLEESAIPDFFYDFINESHNFFK
ncbi:HD domain-containing protein [[Brevibacterium] frigoritolerans]|nr:HD domain-containing protein [Peribacillus frigoritolerans]